MSPFIWQQQSSCPSNQTTITIPYAQTTLKIHLIPDNTITETDWQFEPESPSQSELAAQISQYLHQLQPAPIPFKLQAHGTAFDRQVWAAICAIPLGETRSYKQLAQQLHNAPRAVANACRRNPFPGLVPCHRVTAANGIGGFMGASDGAYIALKQQLLAYEKQLLTTNSQSRI